MCLKKFKAKKKKKEQKFADKLQVKNELNALIELSARMSIERDTLNDQLHLDFQKWIESEKAMRDKSGNMPYCKFCDYAINGQCVAEQYKRIEKRLCAHAYKKYIQDIEHESAKNFTLPDKED